jgi:hypothetical protein
MPPQISERERERKKALRARNIDIVFTSRDEKLRILKSAGAVDYLRQSPTAL